MRVHSGVLGIRWCGWRPVWPGAFKRGHGRANRSACRLETQGKGTPGKQPGCPWSWQSRKHASGSMISCKVASLHSPRSPALPNDVRSTPPFLRPLSLTAKSGFPETENGGCGDRVGMLKSCSSPWSSDTQGVDGAADAFWGGRRHCVRPFAGLSRNPKNLGPFQRVPVMTKAIRDRLE